jgi:hypothetical protein
VTDADFPDADVKVIADEKVSPGEIHSASTTGSPTAAGGDWRPGDEGLVISCDDCVMQHTSTCDDCMVSFILNREPGDAVVFDAAEARALRMLTQVGLVPKPRHVRRVG